MRTNADVVEQLKSLDKIIHDKEIHFFHELADAADTHLINFLKTDLDFLKEKRDELKKKYLTH